MRELKYVITTEFGNSRDFFMIWSSNSNYDDPFGMTWTSFEVFSKCQRQIMVSAKLGTLTLFDTVEDAEVCAKECNLRNYTIRQILFDTDIDADTKMIAGKKEDHCFSEPGISDTALKQLNAIF